MKNIFNRIRSFLDNRKALKQLNINDAIFTVLDTETTGLNVNEGHKIVSVGGIKIKSYQLLEDQILDELINPERDIPFASRNIHYISDDQVKDKPNIYQLEKKISNFLENTILVGHNVDFDIGFIKKNAAKTSLAVTVKKIPSIDTILLAAGLYPSLESYELSFLCDHFRIKTFDQIRHSALGDAIITARLFLFLLDTAKNRNNVHSIGELINLCKQGRQIHYLMKNFNKIH
ncbi:MAG: 3'-5' exonuclease [Candidatus Fonsibacter lacus]|uniref:DNA-directed DNA polymerase n=1 Tax=Candidatus Fonsibacter lacus TaxID=2576439 RepID=A0A966HS84_9PROT|nr:3'-5' exonuclease [Candidatus Fonsibacter lacus]NCU53505.1 3'-5' exonuclease [Candidatus Fonsibacter lacus]NCU72525.1 3'-5' exonuclease [Candidatus Fonsibacter lacus]NDB49351.1 3'-5' exonuclease [Pseudomonadota bacterium]